MSRGHRSDRFKSFFTAGFKFAQDGPQVVAEFANFLITIFGIFCQRAIEDRLQLRRRASWSRLIQPCRLVMKHGVTHIDARLSLKGPGARQHFVKQHPGGKNIRAGVDALTARLLRRRVSRRSVRNADFGQVGVMNAARVCPLAFQEFC